MKRLFSMVLVLAAVAFAQDFSIKHEPLTASEKQKLVDARQNVEAAREALMSAEKAYGDAITSVAAAHGYDASMLQHRPGDAKPYVTVTEKTVTVYKPCKEDEVCP